MSNPHIWPNCVTETNRPIDEVAMEYAILEQDRTYVWDDDLVQLWNHLARRVGAEHTGHLLDKARATLKLITTNN